MGDNDSDKLYKQGEKSSHVHDLSSAFQHMHFWCHNDVIIAPKTGTKW